MRKRRAIIYDDDPSILELLTIFFEDLEYEVITNNQPTDCPVYQDDATCLNRRPCGDIMITDLLMPGMTGLEMLKHQARRGCGIDVRNKAIHSGSLEFGSLEAIGRLGCHFFHKPASLLELRDWVRECESRMDVSQPLGVQRREPREAVSSETVVAVGTDGVEMFAKVVNRSDSGSCLRVDRPFPVGQVVEVQGDSPAAKTDGGEVRWSKPESAGSFLSGLSNR